MRDEGWMEDAACRGADVERFYSTEEPDVRFALSLCAACPVKQLCLAHAMEEREAFGVWGGTREQERRRIFRAQRRRRTAA